MTRLIRLYPRAWRERYGPEYAHLVATMREERRSRLRLTVDIVRGALDAHLMVARSRWYSTDPALRRGVIDGLLISAAVSTVLVLSNVVFPAGPDESDDDPEYLVQIAAGYLVLLVLFVLVGVRARRRSNTVWSTAVGGASAGFVLAVAVTAASLVIDNAFLSLVSQQHDKRVAFEASGWSSMRAYLTLRTLAGAFVVIPAATFLGGLLGMAGGCLPRNGPAPGGTSAPPPGCPPPRPARRRRRGSSP